MKGKYTFADALKEVQGAEPPKRAVLQGFSDLTTQEATRLRVAWPKIVLERRRWLVRSLGELGDDNFDLDFNAVLHNALTDPDDEVRQAAVDGLWESEDEAVAETLLTLLATDPSEGETLLTLLATDPSEGGRAAAASALGQFTYLAELEELDADLARRLHDALVASAGGVEPLEVRRRAVEALGFLGKDPTVQGLIAEAYAHREPSMRISALFAMGRSADARWLEHTLRELESQDAELRFEAARALGEIEDERAVMPLIKALLDSDLEVRLAAVESLGHIGGDQGITALRQMTESEDEAVAEAAAEALDEAEFAKSPLTFGLEDLGLDVRDLGKKSTHEH
ncbi:MAG: HEAT repeat domain-containing protein [Chloroflexi bacterium]|nr:HEAT repeat domain-containing protein [Chloroflexota bacterium]